MFLTFIDKHNNSIFEVTIVRCSNSLYTTLEFTHISKVVVVICSGHLTVT